MGEFGMALVGRGLSWPVMICRWSTPSHKPPAREGFEKHVSSSHYAEEMLTLQSNRCVEFSLGINRGGTYLAIGSCLAPLSCSDQFFETWLRSSDRLGEQTGDPQLCWKHHYESQFDGLIGSNPGCLSISSSGPFKERENPIRGDRKSRVLLEFRVREIAIGLVSLYTVWMIPVQFGLLDNLPQALSNLTFFVGGVFALDVFVSLGRICYDIVPAEGIVQNAIRSFFGVSTAVHVPSITLADITCPQQQRHGCRTIIPVPWDFLTKAQRTIFLLEKGYDKVMKQVYWFRGLPDEMIIPLVSEVTVEDFPPGVVIVLQNEVPTDLYIVVSGVVEVSRTVAKPGGSDTVSIATLTSGTVCGDFGVLLGTLQPFRCQTSTSSTLLKLDAKSCMDILVSYAENPSIIMDNLIKYLVNRPILTSYLTKRDDQLFGRKLPLPLPLALHFAASRGDTGSLHQLLKWGFNNANEVDQKGQTALHRAASAGSKRCVMLLSDSNRTDVNLRDFEGKTAYEEFCIQKLPIVVVVPFNSEEECSSTKRGGGRSFPSVSRRYYLSKCVLRGSVVLQVLHGHIRSPSSNDVVFGKIFDIVGAGFLWSALHNSHSVSKATAFSYASKFTGVTASSIGLLLKACGLRVTAIKIGYLNYLEKLLTDSLFVLDHKSKVACVEVELPIGEAN
ncbi:hypothetical protein RIF29_18151 [Crotalaria pallida]|uniref:Potassium channel n=1 Tax=Crotalaria pallida TaxID=3830 RepID=A0AAN9FID6_CROPI